MSMHFKKGLLGYDTHEVEEKLSLQQKKFEEVYNKYYREFTSLTEENNRLKEELENRKSRNSSDNNIRKKIEEVLYNGHIESCRKIHKAAIRFDNMIEHKTSILKKQQDKNLDINTSIHNLMERIQALALSSESLIKDYDNQRSEDREGTSTRL